jgi:hypothetical protein
MKAKKGIFFVFSPMSIMCTGVANDVWAKKVDKINPSGFIASDDLKTILQEDPR